MKNTLTKDQLKKVEGLFQSLSDLSILLKQLELLELRTRHIERNTYQNKFDLSVTHNEIQELIDGILRIENQLNEFIQK